MKIHITYSSYAALLTIFVLSGIILSGNQLTTLSDVKQENGITISVIRMSTFNVVAVSQNRNGFDGIFGDTTVEIIPGKGRVLVDTSPFVEPETQFSAKTAVAVAQLFTKTDLSDKDIVFSFDLGPDNGVLGGPSAGASLTLATIAAIEDFEIKENVALTGTIQRNGRIGQVGAVLEKAEVAAEQGIDTFLIPRGQRIFMQDNQQIDLKEFAFQEWGLNIIEVSNIRDVVKYAVDD